MLRRYAIHIITVGYRQGIAKYYPETEYFFFKSSAQRRWSQLIGWTQGRRGKDIVELVAYDYIHREVNDGIEIPRVMNSWHR